MYVQSYFWRAQLRSDARCVTRPDCRVRFQGGSTLHHYLGHHDLIIILETDHDLNLHLGLNSWIQIMILRHALQTSFVDPFLSLIKSILVQLATHLFISWTMTFFYLGSAGSSLVVLLLQVGLRAYGTIVWYSTTGVTLACTGNSASVEFKTWEKCCLYKTPRIAAPWENQVMSMQTFCSTRKFLRTHLQ